MRWEEALKIKQNWTAEQARNDLERLIITGERPADKVVGLACKALDMQTPKKGIKTTNSNGKYNVGVCPACKQMLGLYSYAKGFGCCYECGQAIDWSETE